MREKEGGKENQNQNQNNLALIHLLHLFRVCARCRITCAAFSVNDAKTE